MPKKLIIHLVCLLSVFFLLNAIVKWVIIPEIKAFQSVDQKRTQEDLGKVLMDMPLLGEYINKLQIKLDANAEIYADKKNLPYVIEQQFKEQFIYFLQKQILASSQEFIKKDSSFFESSTFSEVSKKTPEFPKTENVKNITPLQDSTSTYFSELSSQLNTLQTDSILLSFQDHIKKLKPTLKKLELEILQYDKNIPEAVLENKNFITDFHYKINEGKEIHLAFLTTSNTIQNQAPNLEAMHGVKAFYQLNTKEQKTTSLIRQLIAPAIEWKSIKTLFPNEKGQRRLSYSESADIFQLWNWQENGNLTVLELFWPPAKNNMNENILYDYVLLFFLLLLGVWFYFFHDSLSKEKNLTSLPNEIETLKKEKKQLENLLIDSMENNHKNEKPLENNNKPETIFFQETKQKSYLIPKEQTYLDTKIDLKKDARDILMEESKTPLLKSLVKKIREE
jgi:hypothetical protein